MVSDIVIFFAWLDVGENVGVYILFDNEVDFKPNGWWFKSMYATLLEIHHCPVYHFRESS